ncbi:MAG TPA: hypothetical protein PKA19_04545, partial [Bacillota bacterium]|nr:hypothetical protein [Bacillota bacterium]
MNVSKLLLTDRDSEYSRALARAVANLYREFEIAIMPLDPQGVTEMDNRVDFGSYDLILIGGYPEEAVAALAGRITKNDGEVKGSIVMLTEYPVESLVRQSENTETRFWYIYKYENTGEIISNLAYLTGAITGRRSLLKKSTTPVMIGFYGVCGGAGRTSVAFGTSRELSRYHDKKVLYLSFEEIPSVEMFMQSGPNRGNLGDYLYFLLEKQDESFGSRPEGFTVTDEFGVEAFYPSKGRNDLNELIQEELVLFFKAISDSSRYHYIILDLSSDLSEKNLYLMNICSKIVMVQNDDPLSELRTQKLVAYMEQLNGSRWKDRMILAVNKANS